MKLCWNAIVRNEAARIVRCMESLIDHVDCAVIVDTGSTDDTIGLICDFFDQHNKRVEVHTHPFINFEDARNHALECARKSALEWDYLLLCDADMELVGRVPELSGAAYSAIQRAGGYLEYANARFVSRLSKASYIGVTHEYLNVPEGIGFIQPKELWFLDHADGANRKDKFERDIALLEEAIQHEPTNERYWFYLAQSYRDAGDTHAALRAYQRRVELGGWEEEQWNAQVNVAHCMLSNGSEEGFVANLLKAHQMRPQRAEALYDLAKYYREKGDNTLATMFARVVDATPKPNDALFVNPFVYEVGGKEELSIAAFYDPKTRAEGFRACDAVALGKHGYIGSTELARRNLFHYVPHAHEVMPSFWSKRIELRRAPDGWALLNPSACRILNQVWCVVRTVNYKITPEGRYDIDGKGSDITADNPIRTRNFLVKLDKELNVKEETEIVAPENVKWGLVRGWEDMRLFHQNHVPHVSATVREANEYGLCQQWMGRLQSDGEVIRVEDAMAMPGFQQYEKNWMPVINGHIRFIYQLGKVVTPGGNMGTRECPVNPEHIRGSSQAIPFRSGYLAIVHEAIHNPQGQRVYFHRFAFFDYELNVKMVSKPFVFHEKQIEFCAGLTRDADGSFLISYGVKDEAAWIAKVDPKDVAEFLFQ